MRRSARRALGYTPVNPDTSPMVQYSQYHWHYVFPQNMEAPRSAVRAREVPHNPVHANVNKFRGVWVDLVLPAAYRVALAPQLEKLPHGRLVPKTPIGEAASDFERLAPLIAEPEVRDAWLAKIAQLGGFQRDGAVVLDLWTKFCGERYRLFSKADVASESSGAGSATSGARRPPPVPLVVGMLFALGSSHHASWKPFFLQCLKPGWNRTPHFSTALWDVLLQCAGALNDEEGVMAILDEMVDVHADLEHLNHESLVHALNAVDTTRPAYHVVKKYLFHFSERKVQGLAAAYRRLRSVEPDAPSALKKENDGMFYHVLWHCSIRQPRQFSPRQLYFDYEPSAVAKAAYNPNAKVDALISEKIENWKKEGLLPEDYEHTSKVFDTSTAFKSVLREERWKKQPKVLKDPKHGYVGDI